MNLFRWVPILNSQFLNSSFSILNLEKKQPACKPGSVSRASTGCLSFISSACHQTALAVYPPTWGEQPSWTPVYMTLQLPRRTALVSPQGRWALTPPSHPYRWNPKAQRRFFSSALLYPRGQLSVRKWDALCCPDFPPAQTAQATGRPTASWVQRYENLSVWQSVVRKSVGSAVSSLLFLFYISLFLLRFKSVSPPFQVRFFFV